VEIDAVEFAAFAFSDSLAKLLDNAALISRLDPSAVVRRTLRPRLCISSCAQAVENLLMLELEGVFLDNRPHVSIITHAQKVLLLSAPSRFIGDLGTDKKSESPETGLSLQRLWVVPTFCGFSPRRR
jgi:hypothetical protein